MEVFVGFCGSLVEIWSSGACDYPQNLLVVLEKILVDQMKSIMKFYTLELTRRAVFVF